MSDRIKLDESEIIDRARSSGVKKDFVLLPHAVQRSKERDISTTDIAYVLKNGQRVKSRDRFDSHLKSWSYCFEGFTTEDFTLRVIICVHDRLLIVTVVLIN